ncbi:MAG: recombinase family protein [Bacteriovoracaceae bacterium]
MSLTENSWPKTLIVEAIHTFKISKENRPKNNRLRYGQRKIKWRIVPHLEEQKVIKKILNLKDEGYSQRYIATYLNLKKVKTKRNGLWDKSVIGEIIKREQEQQT